MNMSSINGSNNSRKSHNPHKSSLFLNMVWWSVGKSINCHIVEAKSDVRPRKFDIFTLNLKKKNV